MRHGLLLLLGYSLFGQFGTHGAFQFLLLSKKFCFGSFQFFLVLLCFVFKPFPLGLELLRYFGTFLLFFLLQTLELFLSLPSLDGSYLVELLLTPGLLGRFNRHRCLLIIDQFVVLFDLRIGVVFADEVIEVLGDTCFYKKLSGSLPLFFLGHVRSVSLVLNSREQGVKFPLLKRIFEKEHLAGAKIDII